MTPALPHPLRLALARTLSWALLIGAWLLLGEAGQRHWPLWAGGLLPLALWLATLGALLAVLQGRSLSRRTLQSALLLGGTASAVALWHASATAALVAAMAWAWLLVAASRVVQGLRRAQPRRPPAPLAPATAGALLAWGLASQATTPAAAGAALAAAALLLAGLLPRQVAAVPGCRAGLFDCSLPMPDPARWRHPADWPPQAARLTMLPMMATLPQMAAWCRSDWGLSSAGSLLLHLAAMLLPALLARRWLARAGERQAQALVTLLLVGGGLLPWLQPGLGGLMAAALLQSAAWSLAWAGPMLRPVAAAGGDRPAAHGTEWRALASALVVLALGMALAAFGPDALRAAQALLAALALAGTAGATWATLSSLRPSASEKHP